MPAGASHGGSGLGTSLGRAPGGGWQGSSPQAHLRRHTGPDGSAHKAWWRPQGNLGTRLQRSQHVSEHHMVPSLPGSGVASEWQML